MVRRKNDDILMVKKVLDKNNTIHCWHCYQSSQVKERKFQEKEILEL